MSSETMTIEEMKDLIVFIAGWSPSVFNNMTDEDIRRVYRERVEERGNKVWCKESGDRWHNL
jgi:hypothetical protein